MKYYRAKDEYYDYFSDYCTIKNQLLTEKERNTRCRYLQDSCFDIVNISSRNTYMSFGVRFKCHDRAWNIVLSSISIQDFSTVKR